MTSHPRWAMIGLAALLLIGCGAPSPAARLAADQGDPTTLRYAAQLAALGPRCTQDAGTLATLAERTAAQMTAAGDAQDAGKVLAYVVAAASNFAARQDCAGLFRLYAVAG